MALALWILSKWLYKVVLQEEVHLLPMIYTYLISEMEIQLPSG